MCGKLQYLIAAGAIFARSAEDSRTGQGHAAAAVGVNVTPDRDLSYGLKAKLRRVAENADGLECMNAYTSVVGKRTTGDLRLRPASSGTGRQT